METNNSQPSSTPSDADAARARFLESMGIPGTPPIEQPPAPETSSVDPSQAIPPSAMVDPEMDEDSGVVLSSSPDDVELPGANSITGSPARVVSVQVGNSAAETSPAPEEAVAPEAETSTSAEINVVAQSATPPPVAETPGTKDPVIEVPPTKAPALDAPTAEDTMETTPPPLQPEELLSDVKSPVGDANASEEIPPPLELAAQAVTPEAPIADEAVAETPDAIDVADSSPAFSAETEDAAPALKPEETAAAAELTAPGAAEEFAVETPVEPTSEETSESAEENLEEANENTDGPLQLHCPKCERELILRREHLGVEGACVWCGTKIVAAESGMDRQIRVFPVFQPDTVSQKAASETTPATETSEDNGISSATEELSAEVENEAGETKEPDTTETSLESASVETENTTNDSVNEAPAPSPEPEAAEEPVKEKDLPCQENSLSGLAPLPAMEAMDIQQAEVSTPENASPASQENEDEVIASAPVDELPVEFEAGLKNPEVSAPSRDAQEFPSTDEALAVPTGMNPVAAVDLSEETPSSMPGGFDVAQPGGQPVENVAEETASPIPSGFDVAQSGAHPVENVAEETASPIPSGFDVAQPGAHPVENVAEETASPIPSGFDVAQPGAHPVENVAEETASPIPSGFDVAQPGAHPVENVAEETASPIPSGFDVAQPGAHPVENVAEETASPIPSGFDVAQPGGQPVENVAEETASPIASGFEFAQPEEQPVETVLEETASPVASGFEFAQPGEQPVESVTEETASPMPSGFEMETANSNSEADIPSAGFESALAGTKTLSPDNGSASSEPVEEKSISNDFSTPHAAPLAVPENTAQAEVSPWPASAETPADEAPAPIGFGELIEKSDPKSEFAIGESPVAEEVGPSSFFSAVQNPASEQALEETAKPELPVEGRDSPDASSELPDPGSRAGGFAIPSATGAEAFTMGEPRMAEAQGSELASSSGPFANAANDSFSEPAPAAAESSTETFPTSWGEANPPHAPDPLDSEVDSKESEDVPKPLESTAAQVEEKPLEEEALSAPNVEKTTLFAPAQTANSGNGLFAPSSPPPIPESDTEGGDDSEPATGASNVEKSPIGAISAPAPDNGKGMRKRPRKGLIIFLVVLIGFVSGAAAVSFFLPVEQYVLKAQSLMETLVNRNGQEAAQTLPTSRPVTLQLNPDSNPAVLPEASPPQPGSVVQPVTPAPPATSPAPAN